MNVKEIHRQEWLEDADLLMEQLRKFMCDEIDADDFKFVMEFLNIDPVETLYATMVFAGWLKIEKGL